MIKITLPYHLISSSILCAIGLLFIFFKRKTIGMKSLFWVSVTVFLVLFFLILVSATYYDIYYQWDLNRYDLDKDGFFGSSEITEEQKVAMQHLANDVGRNFSLITGFIFSLIISSITYIAGLLFNSFKNKNQQEI